MAKQELLGSRDISGAESAELGVCGTQREWNACNVFAVFSLEDQVEDNYLPKNIFTVFESLCQVLC